MPDTSYKGLLCIGDPHLASHTPGYRRDDYPRAILRKLRWALDYAHEHALLPAILGDLFHYPRDNANWLLVELMAMLKGRSVLTVAGNHDCSQDALCEDDSLSVLLAAGRLHALDRHGPWVGVMSDVPVAIGGTCWGQCLPRRVDPAAFANGHLPRYVFWICHHDVRFTGYEESGRLDCREIEGVDLVINGHIHRHLPDQTLGRTCWCNPGNISRISRSDATRAHVPSVLRVEVAGGQWHKYRVEVPCGHFEDVFHPDMELPREASDGQSAFVQGLANLEKYRTSDGQALLDFLNSNLTESNCPPEIAHEIRLLAKEVTHGNETQD